jgi:hypothetical protein
LSCNPFAVSLGISGFQWNGGNQVKTGIVLSVLFATLGQGMALVGLSAQDAPKCVSPANQERAKDVVARRRVELDDLKQAAAFYGIAFELGSRRHRVSCCSCRAAPS